MAVGFRQPPVLLGANPYLSASYPPSERPRPTSSRGGVLAHSQKGVGAVIRAGVLSEFPRQLAGGRAGSYFDDYYNTIYLIPPSINLGAVTRLTERTFHVWNAFVTKQTLTYIGSTGTEGITLAGDTPPVEFRRIEHKAYRVQASTEGPAYIDARYIFTFADVGQVRTLAVVGSRAELWQLAPNWAERYDVSYEFMTDIVTSRSGIEQRRALRETPRKSIEFQAHASENALRWLNRVMGGWHRNAFLMPEMTRDVRTTTPIGEGTPYVDVDEVPYWLKAGASVVLREGGRFGARLVESVDGNRVTFTSGSPDGWIAGSLIHPGLSGRLAPELSSRRLTSNAVTMPVVFNATPGLEVFPDTPVASVTWGPDDTEVVMLKPNYGSSISLAYAWPVENVDYGFGLTRTFVPVTHGRRTWQATYLAMGRDKVQAFLDVFFRAKGRRGEFYMPTWEDDLPVVDDLTPGSFRLRTRGPEVANLLAGDRVYRNVAVLTKDGSVFFNRVGVIGLVDDAQGLDTLFTMTTAWPQPIPRSTIQKVCWMPRWRFASDKLVVSWVTASVATITTSMTTLEDLS